MTLQEEIAAELNEQKTGTVMRVIIYREEADYYIGRTEFDSPEVDCEVLVQKDRRLTIGDFCNVQITQADTFDLYARAL